jgi:hypothetical protein
MNLFLVFESVLLGVVGVLYTKPDTPLPALKGITALGLALTLVWAYSQARHRYILDDLTSLAREVIPEYRDTLERRARTRWPLSNGKVFTYVVPALVILLWIVFLLFL